jgi:small subunit ribosomal protein S1
MTTAGESGIEGKSVEALAHPQAEPKLGNGPLNLEQIRRMRETQAGQESPKASRPPRPPRESSPAAVDAPAASATVEAAPLPRTDEASQVGPAAEAVASSPQTAPVPSQPGVEPSRKGRRPRREPGDDSYTASAPVVAPKVEVPSLRRPMPAELEAELESALLDADLGKLMIGDANLAVGRSIEDGSRQRGRVIKIHQDSVFISLGGPDEGVIPLLQFTDMPQVDDVVDCLVRGFNRDDGLYELALPGEASAVEDWSDIQEGLIVEALIESSNTGGLEAKVGSIRAFIPMRQVSEFRVEDVSGYIGQRLLCVVVEANPRRGNLVLSHRAVLERERQEKRAERLANLEVGQATEGIVRKLTDFGAFVDIGGLEGLLHISQLSYERVKHPSEILKEGDKIQVRVEKIDPDTGKIGLSYRSLQEHPWANVDARFPLGAIVKGTVSRLANFGAFVKLATGIEGLIHVSELSHQRVANVASVLKEGQEIEVKIVSVDRENQRIGLSLKAVQAKPETDKSAVEAVAEVVEPPRRAVVGKYQGPLRGGSSSSSSGGEKFGLKW